jgi:hypothetical protein
MIALGERAICELSIVGGRETTNNTHEHNLLYMHCAAKQQ